MATSPLRLMPGDTPIRLMPEDDQVLASNYAAQAAGGNSFTNSFTGALVGNEANSLAAEEASLRAEGSPGSLLRAEQLRTAIGGLQRKAQAFATAPQQYEDILKDPLQAGSWAAGAVGQGLGSSVGQLATGAGVNALAAGVSAIPHPLAQVAGWGLRGAGTLAMYKQNADLLKGEAYNTAVEDPTLMQRSDVDINDQVTRHGYRAAVLDTLGQMLPVAQVTRGFGKTGQKILSKIPAPVKFAGEMGVEGVTEMGQQISQHYALDDLNPNRDTSGDRSENINSLLGGMVGGGGMAAIGHVGEAALARLAKPAEGKSGDDVSLDGGKDIVADMAGASKNPKFDRNAALAMRSAISGIPPEGLGPQEQEDWDATATQTRKDVILSELVKDGSPKAMALSNDVETVDGSDMDQVFHPALKAAASYLLNKDGPYSEAALKKLESPEMRRGKKKYNLEDDGTFSAPYSSTEVGPGKKASPSAGGTIFKSGERSSGYRKPTQDAATLTGEVKFDATQGELELDGAKAPVRGADPTGTKPSPDARWISATGHKAKSTETADTLWHSLTKASTEVAGRANRHTQALVEDFADEIAAMSSDGHQKPSAEVLDRAEHIGRVLGTMLGDRTEGFMKAAAAINGASAALKHMAESAVAFSGAGDERHNLVQISRDKATDLVLNLISPEARKKLLLKGVSILEDRAAQDLLVDQLEQIAAGESSYSREHLDKVFGVDAVKKMMAVVAPGRIEPLTSEGKSIWGDLHNTVDAVERAEADSTGDLTDDAEAETSEFDKNSEEKSLEKVPPTSMVFHYGRKVGTVTSVAQAFDKYSSPSETDPGRMILPRLIRKGEKTFDGDANGTPVEKLILNAVKTMRGQGKNMKTSAVSALELMDRMGMSAKKREDLMFAYMDQEGSQNKGVGEEERYLMKALRYLNSVKTKFDNVVAKRGDSKVADAAEVEGARISVTKMEELASPADVDLMHKVMKPGTNPATKANALAGIINRTHAALLKHLGADSFEAQVTKFFSERYLVLAEQMSNPDMHDMPLTVFRELTNEGKDRLDETDKAGIKGVKAKREHRAALGLLEFTSPYSTNTGDAKKGTEVIQISELVKWWRDSEGAHTSEGKKQAKEGAVAKDKSPLGKAESYRNDLFAALATLIQNGYITKGTMPWITNAQGKREEFDLSAKSVPWVYTKGLDSSLRTTTAPGAVPPSLNLGSMTQAEYEAARTQVYRDNQGARGERRVSGSEASAYENEVAREQTKEYDVQSSEAVEEGALVEDGSQKWDDQFFSERVVGESIRKAAGDREPGPLSFMAAFKNAGVIAAQIWRGQMSDKQADRGEMMKQVSAYINSMNRDAKADRDGDNANKNVMFGGDHYVAPLAALLTPQHLATIRAEGDLRALGAMSLWRSQVAAKLLTMDLPPNLMTRMVDFLSGYTAQQEQTKLDKKNVPTDATRLAAWQANKAERPNISIKQIAPGQQTAWLTELAQQYLGHRVVDVVKPKGETQKAALMAWQKAGLGGAEKDVSAELAKIDKAETRVADIEKQIAELTPQRIVKPRSEMTEGDTEANKALTLKLSSLSTEHNALKLRLEGRMADIRRAAAKAQPAAFPAKPSTTANVDTVIDEIPGTDAAAIHKYTGRDNELETRKPTPPKLTGVGRTTQLAPFVSQETADMQGAEVAGRLDALTGRITKGLDTKGEAVKPRKFADLPSYKAGQKTMTYAGIGSRQTPANVMALMKKVAARLAELGYTLHSGGADGADTAFESGAGDNAVIFGASDARDETRAIAHEIHPKGPLLGKLATNLMARNTNQVFGADLNSPVDFVLAWTPDGAESTAERSISTGGTGQAIDMASRKGVPVINMARAGWQDRVKEVLAGKHEAQLKAAGPESVDFTKMSDDEFEKYVQDWLDKNRDLMNAVPVAERESSALYQKLEKEDDAMVVEWERREPSTEKVEYTPAQVQHAQKEYYDERVRQAGIIDNIARATDKKDDARIAQHTKELVASTDWLANQEKEFGKYQMQLGYQNYAAKAGKKAEKGGMLSGMGKDKDMIREIYLKTLEEVRGIDSVARLKSMLAAKEKRAEAYKPDYSSMSRQNGRLHDTISGEAQAIRDRIAELTGVKYNDESDYSLIDRVERARAYLQSRRERLGTQGKMASTTERIEKQNADRAIAISSARAYLTRVLGPKIAQMYADHFLDADGKPYKGKWDPVAQAVEIATANPAKILQLAYHESMHGFFTNILKDMPETKEMLARAVSSPAIYGRMQAYLKGSPRALAAIENDMEERVAYAYQFWAASMLDLGQEPKTFFEKFQKFMRKVFDAVRDDEKALAIFTAFNKGELVEPSAAGQAILKVMTSGQWRAKFAQRFDMQTQFLKSVALPNIDVLLNSESATLQKLALKWWRNPADASQASEDGVEGVLDATKRVSNQYQNLVNNILKRMTKQEMIELADALDSKQTPVMPSVAHAQKSIFALTGHFLKYLRDAGMDIGERDDGKFYPMVYDLEGMIERKTEFTQMLMNNYPEVLRAAQKAIVKADPSSTVTPQDVADAMHQAIVDQGGTEGLPPGREDGVLAPYFASENKRSFDWIRPEDRSPFMKKDVVATLTRYFSQGARAAEYTRQFGVDGIKLRDAMARKGDFRMMDADGMPVRYEHDGPVVAELKTAAAKLKLTGVEAEKWVSRRMEDAQRANGALEGVLGKDISAGFRKFNAAAGVYNGYRLLALSLFSAMLDPNGIRVAGGDWDDMFNAYKRGMADVWGTWKDALLGNQIGAADDDQDAVNAAIAGTVDSNMSLDSMGEAHTSEYNAGFAHKANRALFIGNGLSAWDRAMRISATASAMKFIVRHDANADPQHSARWLKGLGLKQGEATIVDGKLIIDRNQLILHRMQQFGTIYEEEAEQASKDIKKIHIALNRWVNRAIVTPNSAQRPTWGSDPHWQSVMHLKQYTYAFQKTTMKYAMDEMAAGNNAAAANMGLGVPIMIAADLTKAMLTGGGSLPGYMANWTMADWIMHGWSRSGNNGIGQFAVDAVTNPASLLGPSAQLTLSTIFGDADVSQKIARMVPGASILANPLGKGLSDMADLAV